MKKVLFLFFVLAIAITACNKKPVMDVRSEIESKNAELVRWYASGQIDSVAGTFAVNARQMASNSAPLVGRDAIEKYWTNLVKLGTWKFTLTAQDVENSGLLAVERGIYTLDFTPGPNAPEGMAAIHDKGNYLIQWQFEDGKWMIVYDLAASEIPCP